MNSERRNLLLKRTIEARIDKYKLGAIILNIDESILKASDAGVFKCTTNIFALEHDQVATIYMHYRYEGLDIQPIDFDVSSNNLYSGKFNIGWAFE